MLLVVASEKVVPHHRAASRRARHRDAVHHVGDVGRARVEVHLGVGVARLRQP